MKKLLKENYKLYIAIFFVILAFFGMFIIKNNGIAIFDGDTFEQMYKFYCGGWEKVHNGTFSMWDYTSGYGANIYSYSLYLLVSPVFLFCLLFPKDFIPNAMFIAMVIEYMMAFIFAQAWLSKLTNNRKGQIVGALIITFCGWALGYTRYQYVLVASVMYPLILCFTEKYLENKKILGLCLSVGILGIFNYYLLYQFIPFLCLYALFRFLIIHKNKLVIKTIIIEAIKFFGLILVGVMISGVIILPAGYVILNSPRFSGDGVSIIEHYSIKALYKVFTSLFTPVFNRQNNNYFIDSSQYEFIGWGGGASLYSLIITPILLPLLIKIKDEFKRNCYLIFLGLLCVFLFFTGFSRLFQATIDTRWYYMFIFLNAMIICEVIENIDKNIINKKYVIYTEIIVIAIIIVSLFVSHKLYFINYDMFSALWKSCLIMIIISLLYAFVLYKGYKQNILIIIMIVEIVYSGFIFYNYNEPIPSDVYKTINKNDAVNWIKENDKSFYRIIYGENYNYDYKEPITLVSANEPFAYDFMGLSFYSSLYNFNQQEFLFRSGDSWSYSQTVGRDKLYNLLSTKYFYANSNNDYTPYGYKLVYTDDEFKVYENSNYVELGFTYPKNRLFSEKEILDYTVFVQDSIMENYLVVDGSTNTDDSLIDKPELLITFEDTPIRVLEFEEPINNVRLTVENFGIPHLSITTKLNDEEIYNYDDWQYDYITIDVTSPINVLILEGEDTYGYGTMVNVYSEQLNDNYSEKFNEMTKNHFTNVKYSNDYVEGDITINNSDDTVFTSIAYDEGWSVYANGKKIDIKKVQLGFIGFNLEAGTYHIEFKYETPYLKTGIIVSLVGVFILLGILYINKKRAK